MKSLTERYYDNEELTKEERDKIFVGKYRINMALCKNNPFGSKRNCFSGKKWHQNRRVNSIHENDALLHMCKTND